MNFIFCRIYVFFLLILIIKTQNFSNSIKNSIEVIEKFKSDQSIPGLVVGINYKGEKVWVQSFGYSDIENDVQMKINTVLRTGSVSKAIETALVSKLVEQSKVVWDSDIHRYISEKSFPKKQWNGEDVNITIRQLISMTGGIRTTQELRDFRQIHDYSNVTETLAYFSGDPLVAKPGTKFVYSNWGWHLIGAVMEFVTQQNFEVIMTELFKEFQMNSTRLSTREAIIANRCRPYTKTTGADKSVVIKSAALIEDLGRPLPWLPMGAIITSVPDLLTFTDIMLKNYKTDGYLKSTTVKELWTRRLSNYGMGWYVDKFIGPYNQTNQYIHYSGSVAGSVCMIGIIVELDISVAVIANLGGVSLDSIALNVLNNFIEYIN